MDNSIEYIKMCRKVDEIQELWEPSEGDAYALDEEVSPNKYSIICYLGCHWEKCPGCQFEVNEMRDECTWLPRQDQLQGIIDRPEFQHPIVLLDLFENFCHPLTGTRNYQMDMMDYTQELKSMEQLWLAFVMYKKFNKKWNGEGWI